MNIVFNYDSVNRQYDRSKVLQLNELKQQNQAAGIKTSTVAAYLPEGAIVGQNDYVISFLPDFSHSGYYNSLVNDYLNGDVSEEAFLNHLVDLYHSDLLVGTNESYEKIPEAQKQSAFNSVIQSTAQGMINYFLKKNLDEWNASAPGSSLFYNAEYHYQCEEILPAFFEKARDLAAQLGMNDNHIAFLEDSPILSVQGRVSIMMSFSRSGGSNFIDIETVPPRDFKIALRTQYPPWEAKVWCGEQSYTKSIPFSWDSKDAHSFLLGALLGKFDIPEKYLATLNNFMLIHRDMANSIPESKALNMLGLNPKIINAINSYDKTTVFA